MTTRALKERFEYATELRHYADEVDKLELASRTDPETPIMAKVELAQRMRRRAREVMRRDDPAERGTYRADVVFADFGKKRPAQVVTAERRNVVRPTGTLGLKAAA